MRLCAFADEASETLDGQLDALKRNGIGLLELRGVDGINVSKLTPEQVKNIKKRLSDNGISVWSLGSPAGKAHLDKDFAPQLEVFKRLCETALTLGATRLRLFSFYPFADGHFDTDLILSRLSAFCDAAPAELVLCHENEKGIYGDTPRRCLEILTALPRLRAVFDPANFVQCGVETLSAWKILSPYVDYLHIKDALPDGCVVPAGQGDGNVETIIGLYLAHGGDVITAEPHLQNFSGLSDLEYGEKTVIRTTALSPSEAFDLGIKSTKALINI